jgi:hypothetical protein
MGLQDAEVSHKHDEDTQTLAMCYRLMLAVACMPAGQAQQLHAAGWLAKAVQLRRGDRIMKRFQLQLRKEGVELLQNFPTRGHALHNFCGSLNGDYIPT